MGRAMEDAKDGIREDLGMAMEDVGEATEDVGWATMEGNTDNDGDMVGKNQDLRTKIISSRFNLYATILSIKPEVH